MNRDPREHCEKNQFSLGWDEILRQGVFDAPSSSVHGYESVHATSFSYIHASRPTGESAKLNPRVCGLVDCIL